MSGHHLGVTDDDFERMVGEAIETLPDEVRPVVAEIAILIEDQEPATERRPGRLLLGLYRGIARTRYGNRPSGSLPDTITLYRRPILSVCATKQQVPDKVRAVLVHKVGHALGMDDQRLRELGV